MGGLGGTLLRSRSYVPQHAAADQAATASDDPPVPLEVSASRLIATPHPGLGRELRTICPRADAEIPEALSEASGRREAERISRRRHQPTSWRPEATHDAEDELLAWCLGNQGERRRSRPALCFGVARR